MIAVLYVDDEPALLDIAKIFLERDGQFFVDTITSAPAALMLMKSKHYDAIIADYQMPEMDGIEFLKTVRAEYGTIPFILFTGRGREEVVIEALNNGADFYLQKGGDPRSQFAELMHKIRSAVDRRRAEDALRTNVERLRMAQAIGKIGSWEYELETRMIWGSEEAFSIFGMNRPTGSVPLDVIESCYVEREKVHNSLVRLIESGEKYDIEIAIMPADGSGQKFIHSVAKLIRNADGNLVKLFGVIQDITERKRVDDALRESEEKHRLLLDESGDPIFSFYANGTYRYVNRAFAEGVGKPVEEIIGRKIYDIFPKDEADKRFSVLMGVFSTGKRDEFEVRVPRHDGDLYYLTTVTPIKNDAGSVISVLCSSKEITDRKRVEEELRQSEEKFRSLVENANDIVYSITLDGTFTYVSPNWTEVLGHKPQDIIGRPVRSFIHPDDLPACRDFLNTALATGEKQAGIEYRVLHRDGTWRWHISNGSLIRGPDGRAVSFMGIARDITDRKLAEKAFHQSEEKYRNLVDNLRDIVWQATPELRFTYVSKSVQQVTGYMPGEVTGRTLFDLLTPESAKITRKRLSDRLDDGRNGIVDSTIFEIEMLTKDGRKIWLEVSSGPAYDMPGGSMIGFQGTSRDITNRKLAEVALADLVLFQQALIDSIPYPVFIKDATGRFVGCNRAYEREFGTTRDYLLGKTVLDLDYLPPEERKRFHAEDMAVIGKVGGRKSYELPIEYADGITHMTLYSVDGFRLTDGRPGGLIGMLVDISDRKKMEDSLKEANRQLNLMTSITRHDINNNITAIHSYLDLAEQKFADPAQVDYIRKLKFATNAIESQIAFTKVYQNLGSQEPQWQNLDTVLPRSFLPDHVSLTADLKDVEIFADPMLEKVFFNLLDNSLRHGERVTQILVSSHPTANGLTIVWQDNGTGIAPDMKEKIFNRGVGKNTGLGLFLAREILSLTGIIITESGIFGKGARFEIVVPNGTYRIHAPVS
nr:PAS domain S-box protein [uncultured Methanoregula sp.]